MMTLELKAAKREDVQKIIRAIEPSFVSPILAAQLPLLWADLSAKQESRLINTAANVAKIINDQYVKPNYGKSQRILSCVVAEESDGENHVEFNIPTSLREYVSINISPTLVVNIRYPSPAWREIGTLMARLVYGNDMRGTVLLEGKWELSYRAALIVCTLGPNLAAPVIDMAQDGLICDFEMLGVQKIAKGLKKKSEYWELL